MDFDASNGGHRFYRAVAGGLPFRFALAAKEKLDLEGNNIKTDSFDSGDPNFSTGGKYDPTKAEAHGDIGAYLGMTNSIGVGNATVYGKVSTGPNGTVYIGPQGYVGDPIWSHKPGQNIEPGYLTDDMNVQFPAVDTPSTAGTYTPGSGSVLGTNYNYLLPAGSGYVHGNLSLSGNDTMLVAGNASLYVDGTFSMSGQASITIVPGASLKLYVGGPSASIGGNGVANSGDASTFILYGLPSCTFVNFAANGAFTGIIYAPNADLTLNGGGSNNQNNPDDFVGAVVAQAILLTGHLSFHYDENLRRLAPMH